MVSALSMFYGLHCVAMLCAQTCTGYRTGPNSESCMALTRRVSAARRRRRRVTCLCLSACLFPLQFFICDMSAESVLCLLSVRFEERQGLSDTAGRVWSVRRTRLCYCLNISTSLRWCHVGQTGDFVSTQ